MVPASLAVGRLILDPPANQASMVTAPLADSQLLACGSRSIASPRLRPLRLRLGHRLSDAVNERDDLSDCRVALVPSGFEHQVVRRGVVPQLDLAWGVGVDRLCQPPLTLSRWLPASARGRGPATTGAACATARGLVLKRRLQRPRQTQ